MKALQRARLFFIEKWYFVEANKVLFRRRSAIPRLIEQIPRLFKVIPRLIWLYPTLFRNNPTLFLL
jgi:hypothetical protein